MNIQKAEQTAHQNAKLKVEFKIHVLAYIVVNSILVTINLYFTPGYLWFIWPLLGWGIGIVFHALSIYYSGNKSIKERMIEAEMKKENQFK